MNRTIDITNVGPIKSLVFDLPDDTGGVLVLMGRNRVGKSTAIRVLRALLSGSGKLAVRDGAVRGAAEAFGKRASISTQTRYTGDCQVESLEGKFDFSDLVHPEAKEAETRDKIRIKALLSLCGVAADSSIFYDLVGGQAAFERLVPADVAKKKDLVELAGIVHRALHAEAKKKESEAEFSAGHAKACREAAGTDEVNGNTELKPLHEASNAAAAERARIEELRRAAADMQAQREESRKSREKVVAEFQGPGLEECEAEYKKRVGIAERAYKEFSKLRDQLATAERALQQANDDGKSWELKKRAAEQHVALVAAIDKAIGDCDRVINEAPTIDQLSTAVLKADQARERLEMGIKLRDAQQKLVQAKGHQDTADKAAKEAERLRESARSVDHVLSQKLPTGPLRAEGGRLVLDTERGESAPFDDCSSGEKWIHALPYGIGAVGENGVLAVQQDAFQDLDREARNKIAEQCRAAKVWIITGEVADGDLRAEVYEPAQEAVA